MRCSLRFMVPVPGRWQRGRAALEYAWAWMRARPALIGRLVVGEGLAQVVEDRLRILTSAANRGFPIAGDGLRRLSPGGKVIGAERIDILAGHRLDFFASARLEIGPWCRNLQRPVAGAMRVHHLLLRWRQRSIFALVQDPDLLGNIKRRVDVIFG